jgi:hypothetical protein
MHRFQAARLGFGSHNPLVFSPTGINQKMVVIDDSLSRNVDRIFAHVNHLIGLAYTPTFDKGLWSG